MRSCHNRVCVGNVEFLSPEGVAPCLIAGLLILLSGFPEEANIYVFCHPEGEFFVISIVDHGFPQIRMTGSLCPDCIGTRQMVYTPERGREHNQTKKCRSLSKKMNRAKSQFVRNQ